jgi:adenine-specific DNA-methyltransferase
MNKEDFIKAGFTVVSEEIKDNKLIAFLKEHYPSVIKDNEINLQELKAVAGLPVDEKVNGYGLNFVGRNFARAKYAQKTDKELRLNKEMSKNIDTTQNLVLKGDNLDCLKILKNYYSGKIKCIYIDPPYNTDKDEFVYPDKFDKEEAEVLGLVNLSEEDFARMEFAFSTKKSHNGWLAFMYPRLLLARDLLSDDGVIFISIDDNEQANLKLLCDEIFGEENFVANCPRKSGAGAAATRSDSELRKLNDFILIYQKNKATFRKKIVGEKEYPFSDERGDYYLVQYQASGSDATRSARPKLYYPIYLLNDGKLTTVKSENTVKTILPDKVNGEDGRWLWNPETFEEKKEWFIVYVDGKLKKKIYFDEEKDQTIYQVEKAWIEDFPNSAGTKVFNDLMGQKGIFNNPKPVDLIKFLINLIPKDNFFVLDFFAGSGTTGHAVMQLNAEDGGNRKFILVQIDEPIKEDKPAYKFCIDNNLQPVISSITIERLRRAGEKIKQEIEEANSKNDVFEEGKKQFPDIGFKVFDSVDAPKLKVDDAGQIQFPELNNDTLSRIYNMIFTVGLDEPTQVPEELVKDCIYKIGNHYYITNSEKITSDDFANAIKNGKVFVDGWTASLNATLQHYKEDVKIVF